MPGAPGAIRREAKRKATAHREPDRIAIVGHRGCGPPSLAKTPPGADMHREAPA